MEWSWRTVLILLGLLLVAGVMIDGVKRMRRARAEALRFDLDKGNISDELYVNHELPQPYRVVDYQSKVETEEQYSEPIFEDLNEDLNEDTEPSQSFEYIEDNDYAEPTAEFETTIELESSTDEVIEQEPIPERLETRPVNLDEDFPVLLDVEELGDDAHPQEPLEQIADSGLDFHEKNAEPFAELAMNEVEPMPEVNAALEQTSVEKASDSEAIYTDEALSVEKDEVVESTEDSTDIQSKASEQSDNIVKDDSTDAYADISETKPKKESKLAPILYASSEAERLAERAEPQMALVIHCISRDELGFSGEDMVNLFNQCDVRFGEREIFHRFEQADGKGTVQFSIVHSFEPRHFSPETILDQHFRGLSLFLKLPGAKNPTAAYEAMVAIAQLLAKHFNADLFDGERSALTQQTIEHERQQIVDFEYRQKVAAKKQALS